MPRIHLHPEPVALNLIEVLAAALSEKPWQSDDPQTAANVLADKLCAAEVVARGSSGDDSLTLVSPTINFSPRYRTYGGATFGYLDQVEGALGLSVEPATITMRKWNTVTLLSAVRFHMLTVLGESTEGNLVWACVALYKANPVLFRRLVRLGAVKNMVPKDTYTSETWERICNAGLGSSFTGRFTVPGSKSRALATVTHFLATGETELPEVEQDDEIDGVAIGQAVVAAANAMTDEDWAGTDPDDDDDDLDESTAAGSELSDAVLPGERPSEAVMRMMEDREDTDEDAGVPETPRDSLDSLGIVALRKVSRGAVSGGYSMQKPELIEAIRGALVASEIESRVNSL